ncbi:preprotein translocase subunit TatC [Thermosulfurimonas marina]|uniref:Sec-independent protein translocase protein TatC n=1 Tax=Thermosulfurimonas marina TaxID=2047767 RepID=A0A6H1WUM2_9BACT|nr:twin-arginine translocase subunit TatC [Thermosulfurimonas marina]QJA06854.1 preprotein translocase subunit TatC [Thermosulfurimonas marina]
MSEEAPLKDLVRALLVLRRYLLRILLLLFLLTLGFLWTAPRLLLWLEGHFGQRLAFFGVAESWLAVLKLALILALTVAFPLILYLLWRALSAVYGLSWRSGLALVLGGSLLFYGGMTFCFFVSLPYGMRFLLSFGRGELVPTISVGHFVNFVGLFLLAFGLIFEVPLLMMLAARIGLLDPYKAARFRRHAILIIAILAAVLTPTPDVFNMSLMAVPLYLLFEVGLLGARLLRPKSS